MQLAVEPSLARKHCQEGIQKQQVGKKFPTAPGKSQATTPTSATALLLKSSSKNEQHPYFSLG